MLYCYQQLLSTYTKQRGNDDEGIFGFLEADIRSSLRNVRMHRCSYCQKSNAYIHCADETCDRKFHLPCGLKNNCLSQFSGEFRSYCSHHLPPFARRELTGSNVCAICIEPFLETNPIMRVPPCLRTEVCLKSKFQNFSFHRHCIMKQAATSGAYQLRCNICLYHSEEYVKELRDRGIFVPESDAEWEQTDRPEGDAFAHLLYRPSTCGALHCYCPEGRNHRVIRRGVASDWNIKICAACGAHGIHVGCMQSYSEIFTCADCYAVTNRIRTSVTASTSTTSDADRTGENPQNNSIYSVDPEDILAVVAIDVEHAENYSSTPSTASDTINDIQPKITKDIETIDIDSDEDIIDDDALTLKESIKLFMNKTEYQNDSSESDVEIIDDAISFNQNKP